MSQVSFSGTVANSRFDRFHSLIAGRVTAYSVSTVAVFFASIRAEMDVHRPLAGLGLGGVTPDLDRSVTEYAPERLRGTLASVVFGGYVIGGLSRRRGVLGPGFCQRPHRATSAWSKGLGRCTGVGRIGAIAGPSEDTPLCADALLRVDCLAFAVPGLVAEVAVFLVRDRSGAVCRETVSSEAAEA